MTRYECEAELERIDKIRRMKFDLEEIIRARRELEVKFAEMERQVQDARDAAEDLLADERANAEYEIEELRKQENDLETKIMAREEGKE